jgi:hypothetical protein
MKKILFFCSFLVLTILISSCSSEKQIAAKPKPKAPEKPIYAVIYYEIVDWGECNNDPTGRFNNAEFYMTVESDLKPAEKFILPISTDGSIKKERGYLTTPIVYSKQKETLLINLIDEDNTDPKIVEMIKSAEKIGGTVLLKDQRLFLFKTALEYVTKKSWDQVLNEKVFKFEGFEPCGSIRYDAPTSTPARNLRDAQWMEIRDHGWLKMKVKVYYTTLD